MRVGVQMISMQMKSTLRAVLGEEQGGMTIRETGDCTNGCVILHINIYRFRKSFSAIREVKYIFGE